MWVFTQNGFLSAVRTANGSPEFKVRSRDRQALQGLAQYAEVEIIATPYADYPYRVIVDELLLGGYLLNELATADYTNYKDRVQVLRGKQYAQACAKVWSTMHDVEDEKARTI
ncbi:MAG: hypothetical protein EBS36_03755 [Actinobacteria bacterium]|nr:hypothetical protein [Actinomycetota bacterium]NBY15670.1 hypothetical protein [Actinomycetota bacterium]